MKYHLPERIIRELYSFAQKYAVTKIVLFGSRTRGTNTEKSDIDIAVYDGDFNRVSKSPASIARSNEQWVGSGLYQEWYKPLLISCEAATRL